VRAQQKSSCGVPRKTNGRISIVPELINVEYSAWGVRRKFGVWPGQAVGRVAGPCARPGPPGQGANVRGRAAIGCSFPSRKILCCGCNCPPIPPAPSSFEFGVESFTKNSKKKNLTHNSSLTHRSLCASMDPRGVISARPTAARLTHKKKYFFWGEPPPKPSQNKKKKKKTQKKYRRGRHQTPQSRDLGMANAASRK